MTYSTQGIETARLLYVRTGRKKFLLKYLTMKNQLSAVNLGTLTAKMGEL